MSYGCHKCFFWGEHLFERKTMEIHSPQIRTILSWTVTLGQSPMQINWQTGQANERALWNMACFWSLQQMLLLPAKTVFAISRSKTLSVLTYT